MVITISVITVMIMLMKLLCQAGRCVDFGVAWFRKILVGIGNNLLEFPHVCVCVCVCVCVHVCMCEHSSLEISTTVANSW